MGFWHKEWQNILTAVLKFCVGSYNFDGLNWGWVVYIFVPRLQY